MGEHENHEKQDCPSKTLFRILRPRLNSRLAEHMPSRLAERRKSAIDLTCSKAARPSQTDNIVWLE